MNAIYSFKEFPEHNKPINNNFYDLAKISIKSAKKYYNTVLYCDMEVYNKFTENGLIFDKVVILDEITNYQGRLYCYPKICAMMQQTEPYIMLDFDSVILEKIETTHTITYGYYEVDLNKHINSHGLMWAVYHHLELFEKIKHLFPLNETINYDWTTYPNFSVLVVKNPFIISHIYKTILNTIPSEELEKLTPTFVEQFMCYQYVKMYGVDYGVLVDNMFEHDYNIYCDDFKIERFISKKYQHVHLHDLKLDKILGLFNQII